MWYPMVDMAEQTMVSTCERGGDCGGGFFSAFNYVQEKGLPPESEDPYTARNSSCKSGLSTFPNSKITRWSYVGTSGRNPTTEQIKQAIYDHGPVTVDINGSLSSRTGVYTSCGSTGTNHMVVLDGWVDDPAYSKYGGGYWIMRNSWGTNWSEGGYMRIVYKSSGGRNCNGVGNVTAYAVVNGVENVREYLGLQ
jgi:cathepsin L